MSLFDPAPFTRGRPRQPKPTPRVDPVEVEVGRDGWVLTRRTSGKQTIIEAHLVDARFDRSGNHAVRTRCERRLPTITAEAGTRAPACAECFERGG